MADLVNDYFQQFYPSPLDPKKWEFTSMLGGMWRYEDYTVEKVFPAMVFADGFTMSVQGHSGAYRRPRSDFGGAHGESYTMVEAGFPSEREELLMPYAEDAERPTETVYGYVPVSVIEAIAAKHGGLLSP